MFSTSVNAPRLYRHISHDVDLYNILNLKNNQQNHSVCACSKSLFSNSIVLRFHYLEFEFVTKLNIRENVMLASYEVLALLSSFFMVDTAIELWNFLCDFQ